MNSDNKNVVRETGRWLRVGALTLSVLGPVANTVVSRMRERVEVLRKEAEKQGRVTYSQSQERLKTMSASVADAVNDLKDHPYNKEVLKELVKRSEKPDQKQSDQVGTFWTVFGFSTGLTAALIAGYLLIRKRIQRNEEENQQVQISQNGYLNGSSKSTRAGEIRSVSPSTSAMNMSTTPTAEEPPPSIAAAEPTTEPVEDRTKAQRQQPSDAVSANSVSVQGTATPPTTVENSTKGESVAGERNIPAATAADSTFLGVVSTKLYYPVETPLSQLASPENGSLDVVYFVSEDEAKAQGFSAAE